MIKSHVKERVKSHVVAKPKKDKSKINLNETLITQAKWLSIEERFKHLEETQEEIYELLEFTVRKLWDVRNEFRQGLQTSETKSSELETELRELQELLMDKLKTKRQQEEVYGKVF